MKKKIIFLISTLGSGGAERTVCNLSSGFAAKGYDTAILMLNYRERSTYPVDSRVRILSLVNDERGGSITARLRVVIKTFFRLMKVLRVEKPSIVVAFQTTANNWGGLGCYLRRIPYIVSERTSPNRKLDKTSRPFQKLTSFIYKKAKAVVAPSNGILKALKEIKSFSGLTNTVLIQNSVDQPRELRISKVHDRKFLLAAGRLNYVKGFDLLIDSFSLIQKPDVDLLIAGQGLEHNALSKKISGMGLENRVFLLGEVDNINDYYRQCEVFVLPSRNEGYPNVLIEAMSVGAPCVSFDCEFGPAEIIRNDENGLLVNTGDTHKLAEAVCRVLDCESLRKKIGDAGKEVLVTNSFERILNQWESLVLKYA